MKASNPDQMDKMIRVYEQRLTATMKNSVQDTIGNAQVPVGAGGRMRIKTGFLRASIQAAIGSMPSGPTRGTGEKDEKYPIGAQVAGEPVAAALLRWNPFTQTFFVGWTASYARAREYKDGYLRTATNKWQQTVKRNAAEAKKQI